MTPKMLHVVWIGDESKMPAKCVQSWADKNPDYELHIWGNGHLTNYPWHNQKQIDQMMDKKDYAGVADLMRYEILYRFGGIALDADSYCQRPLEDWLLEPPAFSSWEQEHVRNNLIATTFMGGVKRNPFWKECIDRLHETDCSEPKLAWLITGPKLVTEVYFANVAPFTVYPSHLFIKHHHSGFVTKAEGHRFADHLWGSAIGYDNMDSHIKE
jgi:inositol phosphorylceramide mannosyltransferase catalytic subunit